MRLSGRVARPANAAAVKMIDEAGSAQPGVGATLFRVGRPITAARPESGIAHQRLGEQANQGLAIDIHSAEDTARTNGEQCRRSLSKAADLAPGCGLGPSGRPNGDVTQKRR